MHEVNLPSPDYYMDGMFTVIFQRPTKKSRQSLEKTVEETVEETIINLIRNNSKVTAKEMIKATGLSRRGIEYQINKLKNTEIIKRVESTKGGYWLIFKTQ